MIREPVRRSFRPIAILVLATMLEVTVSCGGNDVKPPAETQVSIRITAERGASKGPNGESLPISVLFFELSSAGKFRGGDFFGLYDEPAQLLGADLVGSERVSLPPGGTERLTRKVDPSVRYLGVLAAYRNIDNVSWRDSLPLKANQVNDIVVDVRAEGVWAYYANAHKSP
jgi:type VI secretion system protein VasD